MKIKSRLEKLEAIQAEKAAQQSKVVGKSRLAEIMANFNDPNYVTTPHVKKPRPKNGKEMSVLNSIMVDMIGDEYWAD